jgi:hypothetical protein
LVRTLYWIWIWNTLNFNIKIDLEVELMLKDQRSSRVEGAAEVTDRKAMEISTYLRKQALPSLSPEAKGDS